MHNLLDLGLLNRTIQGSGHLLGHLVPRPLVSKRVERYDWLPTQDFPHFFSESSKPDLIPTLIHLPIRSKTCCSTQLFLVFGTFMPCCISERAVIRFGSPTTFFFRIRSTHNPDLFPVSIHLPLQSKINKGSCYSEQLLLVFGSFSWRFYNHRFPRHLRNQPVPSLIHLPLRSKINKESYSSKQLLLVFGTFRQYLREIWKVVVKFTDREVSLGRRWSSPPERLFTQRDTVSKSAVSTLTARDFSHREIWNSGVGGDEVHGPRDFSLREIWMVSWWILVLPLQMPGADCVHGLRKHRCAKCHPERYFCSHQKRRDSCLECKRPNLEEWPFPDEVLTFEARVRVVLPPSCGLLECAHGLTRSSCLECELLECPHGNFQSTCRM